MTNPKYPNYTLEAQIDRSTTVGQMKAPTGRGGNMINILWVSAAAMFLAGFFAMHLSVYAGAGLAIIGAVIAFQAWTEYLEVRRIRRMRKSFGRWPL